MSVIVTKASLMKNFLYHFRPYLRLNRQSAAVTDAKNVVRRGFQHPCEMGKLDKPIDRLARDDLLYGRLGAVHGDRNILMP